MIKKINPICNTNADIPCWLDNVLVSGVICTFFCFMLLTVVYNLFRQFKRDGALCTLCEPFSMKTFPPSRSLSHCQIGGTTIQIPSFGITYIPSTKANSTGHDPFTVFIVIIIAPYYTKTDIDHYTCTTTGRRVSQTMSIKPMKSY